MFNIHLLGVPERKERIGQKQYLIGKKCPKLMKDTNLYISEPCQKRK